MRFFVTEDRISGELIDLEPTDAQHVSRVLRMRPGEAITVCCGNGRSYRCLLEQVGKTEVTARIVGEEEFNNEPTAFVTVYAGLSKGDRFEIRTADMKTASVTVADVFDNHIYDYVILSSQTYQALSRYSEMPR